MSTITTNTETRTQSEIDEDAKLVFSETGEPAPTQHLKELATESGESFEDFMARNFKSHGTEMARKDAATKGVDALKEGSPYGEALKLLLPLGRQERETFLKLIAKNTGASYRDAVKADFNDLLKEKRKRDKDSAERQKKEDAAKGQATQRVKYFKPPSIDEAVAARDFLAICTHAVRRELIGRNGETLTYEAIREIDDETIGNATEDIRKAPEARDCLEEFKRDLAMVKAMLLTEVAITEAAMLLCIDVTVSLCGSIYTFTSKKDGAFPKHLCSCILIDAQGGKRDGKGWCLRVKVRNPAKQFTDVVLSFEDITTGNAVTLLAAAGLQVGGRGDKELLMLLLSRVQAPRLRVVADVQSGWIDPENPEAFVWGTEVLTRDGTSTEIIVQGGRPLSSRGTLEEWKKEVASLADGNECYASAILYACMAPAKRLFGIPSGGSNAHAKSRNGKSTGSYMGLSLSEPPSGKLNYDASGAGLERTFALRNDRFVALEGTERADDPQTVQHYAYLAGDGTTRVIADAKSDKDVREPIPFDVEVYSSGEESNKTLFETAGLGYKNGAEARMPNIPHVRSRNNHGRIDGARLADDILELCGRYHGTAFPAVIRMLMDQAVRGRIKARADKLRLSMTPTEADGEEHDVIKRFALAAAVGEACVRVDILPWTEDYPEKVMRSEYTRWLEGRGGHGDMSALTGIDQARAFIFKSKHRFQDKSNSDGHPPINRVGFYKGAAKHGKLWWEEYIVPACERAALTEIFGTSEFQRAIAELESRTVEALKTASLNSNMQPMMLLTPKTVKLFAGKKPAKSDKGLRVKRFGEPSYVLLKVLDEETAKCHENWEKAADRAKKAKQEEKAASAAASAPQIPKSRVKPTTVH